MSGERRPEPEPKPDDRVEDLDVNEADADQVKGGDKNTPVARYNLVDAWPTKYSG